MGGFWILDVKDLDTAVAWARRIPFVEGEVEVRKVSEVTDFETNDITPRGARKRAGVA